MLARADGPAWVQAALVRDLAYRMLPMDA